MPDVANVSPGQLSLSAMMGAAGVGSPVGPPSCQSCGAVLSHDGSIGTMGFAYAIGRLEPRFPTIGVEKELAQAVGKTGTANLTDREAVHAVLSQPDYFYLVRQLCWVLTISGSDSYVIVPGDTEDVRMLVGALRSMPRAGDIDVVVGWLGPLSDGRGCNGARLPTIRLAQLYSFDVDGFIKHVSSQIGSSEDKLAPTVEEVLERISQVTGNMGIRDDHRAANYLVTRDSSIYTEVSSHYGHNYSLTGVTMNVSPLSGTRRIIEVILDFRHRENDTSDRRFAKVDVSDVFPFRVSKWAPYTNR